MTLTGFNGGWKLEEIAHNVNIPDLNSTETEEIPIEESLLPKASLIPNQAVDNGNVSSEHSSLCNDSSTKSLI